MRIGGPRREINPDSCKVVDVGTGLVAQFGYYGPRKRAHQPLHQVEDVPAVIDKDPPTQLCFASPALAASGGSLPGGTIAQAIKRKVDDRAQSPSRNQLVCTAIGRSVLPVVDAHQHARRLGGCMLK